MTSRGRHSLQELEDAFVKVSFETDVPNQPSSDDPVQDPFYNPWFERGSGKFTDPAGFGAIALRKIYPGHSVTPFYNSNVLGFPGALVQPVSPPDVVSALVFIPLARRMGGSSGILIDSVRFGLFKVAWDKYDFLLYVVRYPQGFGDMTMQYVLHEGSDEPSRALLVTAGAWDNDLHEEIYVFNQGFWNKDHGLWLEVQKANWKDVILKDEFKSSLRKDINGFFASEELYRSLAIPWKRGLIMYGPPGNGKTISMKAIMKECDAKGYAPLYVRSFQSWMGEEASMAACFEKARQMSPSVLVLEDLDSLINDQNRSFFLNELDGLEGNDGILIIGSTNHFEKLDPALSGRPSRFDRKYPFDDPDKDERGLYCKYWQNKLKSNKGIEFPDSLVDEIVAATEKFSFAYLKEAFVSTLVLLAGQEEGDKQPFRTVIRHQIKSLRDQLNKDPDQHGHKKPASPSRFISAIPSAHGRHDTPNQRDRSAFDRLTQVGRLWDSGSTDIRVAGSMPGALPGGSGGNGANGSGSQSGLGSQSNIAEVGREVRNRAMAAAALGRSYIL